MKKSKWIELLTALALGAGLAAPLCQAGWLIDGMPPGMSVIIPVGGGNVESVNSQTGVVVLTAADVGAVAVDDPVYTQTVARADGAVQADDAGYTNAVARALGALPADGSEAMTGTLRVDVLTTNAADRITVQSDVEVTGDLTVLGDHRFHGDLIPAGGPGALPGTTNAITPDGLVDIGPLLSAQGGGGSATVTPTRLVFVDRFRTEMPRDGTYLRPFADVQAAMDYIGTAGDPAEYQDPDQRYWRVLVAPGHYIGDVEIPFRPFIGIELDSALIEGDVRRSFPDWEMERTDWDVDGSNLVPTLVIRGNSLRSAYEVDRPNPLPLVGVKGDVVLETESTNAFRIPTQFVSLHVTHAGITGDIRFERGAGGKGWGHVFLTQAAAGRIVSTQLWGGVTLFANGWSMGHTGEGNPGSGIGPLVGGVLPYNLQSTLISGGMTLTNQFTAASTCIWHNVTFEPGTYDVSGAGNSVLLDTASYRSWAAAAADGDRGPWVLGDGMTLSDAPMGLTTNVAVSGITLRFIDGVFDGIEP